MAIRKYVVYVNKEIGRFEAILDVASIFVKIKSKKIQDGKYVLEGSLDVVETLIHNFANGIMAITKIDAEHSSANMKMSGAKITISEGERDQIESIVNRLISNSPEWVVMYLAGCDYDEENNEYI